MIKIADKTILNKHWANAGVMKINNLMTCDLSCYSCFKDEFGFPLSFFKLCGVTLVIRSAMRPRNKTFQVKKF